MQSGEPGLVGNSAAFPRATVTATLFGAGLLTAPQARPKVSRHPFRLGFPCSNPCSARASDHAVHFASNRRAIVSFDVKDRGEDFCLTVGSTMGDPPSSQAGVGD